MEAYKTKRYGSTVAKQSKSSKLRSQRERRMPRFETVHRLHFFVFALDCGIRLSRIDNYSQKSLLANKVDGRTLARRVDKNVRVCVVYDERKELRFDFAS